MKARPKSGSFENTQRSDNGNSIKKTYKYSGSRRSLAKWALATASSPLLAACAGTAPGSDLSFHGMEDRDATYFAPDGGSSFSVVVIRYPTISDDESKAAFVHAYAHLAFGGDYNAQLAMDQVEPIVHNCLTKTVYFAHELYFALVDKISAELVVLEPAEIQYNGSQFVQRPLGTASRPPAAVTVDFFMYSHPDAGQLMDSAVVSFGDLIGPWVTVRTSPQASPETAGLLVAPDLVINEGSLNSSLDKESATILDVLNSRSSAGTTLTFRTTASWPPSRDEVFLYSFRSIELARTVIENIGPGRDNKQFLMIEKVDPLASAVVYFLRRFADTEPIRAAVAEYAKNNYDANFGGNRAFDSIIEKCIATEQQFLSEKSAKMASSIVRGNYGENVRLLVHTETEVLDERRELATGANINMVGAILLSGLGAYSAGLGVNPAPSMQGVNMATNAFVQLKGQDFVIQDALDEKFHESYNEQFLFTETVINGERQVSADNFLTLKEQLKTIYEDLKSV